QVIELSSTIPPTFEVVPVAITNDLNSSFERVARDMEKRSAEVHVENKFLLEFRKQSDLAEKHFQRFQREAAKEKDAYINLEKVRIQLKNALDQIKSSKKQVELNKLQGLVRIGIRKIQKEKVTTLLPDMNVFKMNELELLEKQIESVIDSITQPKFFTTAFNADLNYNFQLPPVVYTFSPGERAHSFSYEYSAKPRTRVINAPAATGCPENVKKRNERVMIIDNEDEAKQFEMVAPPTLRATTKLRAAYVIKI
ncbi:MAG: hypothetical protein JWQ09_903, partial [Segetibacter sp.]|nr:hypothetical protein [Segetibacter sp.]